MGIQAITVDFWGTLFFDGPRSDDRYRRQRLAEFETILAGAGLPISRAALERGYEASGAWLARLWSAHRDVPVEEHVRALLAAADPKVAARVDAPLLAALVDAYARPALLVPPTVDPAAPRALEALAARGYRLAVVSNTMRTPGRVLRTLLARQGLLARFAHTTFSDEVGVRKPDPAIFRQTLAALGVEPAAAVHVGDDPVLDVAGARAAGLRVVQVTARGEPATGADVTIASLEGLPEAIATLERG